MTGIDANVLVALAAESHPSHSQAVTVFERELSADEEFAPSLWRRNFFTSLPTRDGSLPL